MSRAMLMHEVTFRELWEATVALEIATVEQAAEHATADVVAELEANVVSTEHAPVIRARSPNWIRNSIP